jgi:hypothetical protein
MATATQKSRTSRQVRRHAGVTGSAAIAFLVFEDNSGNYCWTVLGPDGDSLARSRPYATHELAADAVRVMRDGAGTARFDAGPVSDGLIDLVA